MKLFTVNLYECHSRFAANRTGSRANSLTSSTLEVEYGVLRYMAGEECTAGHAWRHALVHTVCIRHTLVQRTPCVQTGACYKLVQLLMCTCRH